MGKTHHTVADLPTSWKFKSARLIRMKCKSTFAGNHHQSYSLFVPKYCSFSFREVSCCLKGDTAISDLIFSVLNNKNMKCQNRDSPWFFGTVGKSAFDFHIVTLNCYLHLPDFRTLDRASTSPLVSRRGENPKEKDGNFCWADFY